MINITTVSLERFAELVESKMAVSKAARQVAAELEAFDEYCRGAKKFPTFITTDNLRTCKYK